VTVTSIRYRVPDLAETHRFYRDILGFSVAEGGGVLTCALRHGAEVKFEQADVAAHQADKASRYWKIGLTMPDLDRAVAHLEDAEREKLFAGNALAFYRIDLAVDA